MNLFTAEVFTDYTLTNEDYIFFTKVFSALILIVFFVGKLVCPTTKQLAWIISVLNAVVMIVATIIYNIAKWPDIIKTVSNLENAAHLFHARNDFCSIICLYFALGCFYDLVLGIIFYPKYVQLLTGYIHHTVYIWIMMFSISGNGGFVTSRPFSPCFIHAGLEEVPTLILALGSIDAKYRSDQGFGITFFLFRILMHASMFAYSVYSKCDTSTFMIYVFTLALHLHWFWTWIRKYSKPVKADKNTKKAS